MSAGVLPLTAVCSGILRIGSQPDTHASCSLAGLVARSHLEAVHKRVSLDGDQAGTQPGQILYTLHHLAAWIDLLVKRVSGLVWPVKRPMDQSRADYCISWLPPVWACLPVASQNDWTGAKVQYKSRHPDTSWVCSPP